MKNLQNACLRIPQGLYGFMLEDLRRPHSHAFERVGFLYARMGNVDSKPLLLLATDYSPVLDDQYIEDTSCGAKIGSNVIRGAMQRVMESGECAFHVHLHDHLGKPGFGTTDQKSLPGVVRSLRNACPKSVHGMLVFSDDHGIADVRLPGSDSLSALSRISIVGQPMTFMDRSSHA